jgi:hypothetical protein
MTRTARKPQLFTVREVGTNGLCGRYYALTADQAIRRFWDDQAALSATFRRSMPFRKFPVTATVEPPVEW